MQLIRITNLPIQYQYEFEQARLEAKKSKPLEGKTEFTPPEMNIQTKNIQVRLSMEAMRESMGIHNNDSLARMSAQKGWEKASEAVSDTVSTGNQMEGFYKGVTIGQIMRGKAISGPNFQTVFMPSEDVDISWDPAQVKTDYKAGSVEIDWDTTRQAMEYIPGKFSLVITQYPKVSIEYLGGINYVPPSSDPEYVAD